MANIADFFKVMLIVQLFFSFGITAYVYALPDDSLQYISEYRNLNSQVNLSSINREVTDDLESQKNIPLVDVGSLVFYSGNLLIDLILNFAFALPEMLGLLIAGMTNLINLPGELVYIVQAFAGAVVIVLYVVSLMQLLTGIRSGRIA